MTDVAIRRLDTTSDLARSRVRARYRAEARFKAYGVLALVLTAVFLLIVIGDILYKGLPAFVQYRLELPVAVAADAFDPPGSTDEAVLRAGDYRKLVRDALRAQFPDITDRTSRRSLDGLLSSGAAYILRERVVANPELVGQTVTVPVLLSDDAELYFKGYGTEIVRRPGQAAITPSDVTGDITVAGAAAAGVAVLPGIRAKSPAGEPVALDGQSPSFLLELNGGVVKVTELGASDVRGEVLLPLQSTQTAAAGSWQSVLYATAEDNRRLTDREITYLQALDAKGLASPSFNQRFFTSSDSREPELAGIRGALVGSALTLLVTLIVCLPLGVGAAIYLEEFAPKNRLTEVIEVNINNLAAVPSIVFGLLGLAIFLNFLGLPRSAPIVGGLVLALLVLPTIIIASRAALRAVPPSIKEAALGIGASHQQAIFHHVLPLAMPGIMTGTIIGMAHALGETAPLLMIGMVAFIVEVPGGVTDPSTVLPVQIFLWSDLPEVAFRTKTAAAIIVLLVFLFVMNGLAIFLRRKFERRW